MDKKEFIRLNKFVADDEDLKIRSSVEEIKKFLDSNIWKDIRDQLNARLLMSYSALELALELPEVRAAQENIKLLKQVLEIPEYLKEEQEIQRESNKKQQEDAE